LIASGNSREEKGMDLLLESLSGVRSVAAAEQVEEEPLLSRLAPRAWPVASEQVRLALPDGHQQQPTAELLSRLGFEVSDYLEGYPRPSLGSDSVVAKVIRPQDMPSQVANANFDLAITGRDWLLDHIYRFPSSPVKELLDLGFGRVRLSAVVSQALGIDDVDDLRELLRRGDIPPLRIASEYVNIADKYARDRHLGPYRIIPTWGASEAFLPEDADLLIENVQTGQTIARHRLKSIDTIFSSSACLIGSTNSSAGAARERKLTSLIEAFRSYLVQSRGLRN
jgi:ATP phosphoribosyltransferase